MLMSMLTITLLKSGWSSLKLIQDHYPGLFQFFRGVILELIWGKLQRSPSPLPTYLKSKRLVNTHLSWSMCCKWGSSCMKGSFEQLLPATDAFWSHWSTCLALHDKVLECLERNWLLSDQSKRLGEGAADPHSPDLESLFCKAPPWGGQLLFHTCPEPLKSWRPQSDSIDSTSQDILHEKNVWYCVTRY